MKVLEANLNTTPPGGSEVMKNASFSISWWLLSEVRLSVEMLSTLRRGMGTTTSSWDNHCTEKWTMKKMFYRVFGTATG